MVFIEKKEGGAAVNFDHNPYYDQEKRINQETGTVYDRMVGKNKRNWPLNRIGLMTDVTRIFMEGIELTPEVVDQPTFFMGPDNKPATVREVLAQAKAYKEARKPRKKGEKKSTKEIDKEMHELIEPNNIYELADEQPELVKQHILERLRYQAEHNMPFRMGERVLQPAELIMEVENGTFVGQSVMELEIAKIGSFAQLLWQEALVRRGSSREVVLPD